MSSSSSRLSNIFNCLKIDTSIIKETIATSENSFLISTLDSNPLYKYLLGNSIAEISQWLSLSQSFKIDDLSSINEWLILKSYLVGNNYTVADVSVYVAICSDTNALATINDTTLLQLKRWFSHIQYLCNQTNLSNINISSLPTIIPSYTILNEKTTEVKSTTEEVNSKGKNNVKIDDKIDKKVEIKKEEVKASAELDPSKLDFKVGIVTNCWTHPEAEKLLCEEIDLGEENKRTIASGIRAHYTPEEVIGRKVIVLANLKDRTMVGFKSQGMVMCACNPDHTIVKLLEAPESAKPGDRVQFPGYNSEAATPAQVGKKKILEGLASEFKTDSKGVAHWGKSPFTLGTDVVTSALPYAQVS
jgi:aminoacyl tRNA synthase complex-interacting multifunctional protein 1